ARRVVVEEDDWLRAAHDDVVDAHRDEIDPDGVVASARERELELGADAVGPGDQHGLSVPLRYLEEPAESADAGEDFGPHGATGMGLEPLDESVAFVDVHAGVAIGQPHGGAHLSPRPPGPQRAATRVEHHFRKAARRRPARAHERVECSASTANYRRFPTPVHNVAKLTGLV